MGVEIAQTILQQLGGRRFAVMTGAKNFIGGENYLSFSLPRGFAKDGINKIKITLDPCDTYTFEAGKVTIRPTPKYETIFTADNVYDDGLQRVFTEATGLDTHL